MFKAGCTTYANDPTKPADWYRPSTNVMKKYKIQHRFNSQWFEYKSNMDIVEGIDSPSNAVWKSYTAPDVCPMIKCFINTGTADGDPTNVATSTCTAQSSNVNNKLAFV